MSDAFLSWLAGDNDETALLIEGAAPQLEAGLAFPPPYQPIPAPFAGYEDPETLFGAQSFGSLHGALSGLTGRTILGFVGDLYDRVHLIPTSVSLGVLLAEELVPVEVWNAFDAAKLLTSIDEINTDNIALITPIPPGTPPTNFRGLSSYVYIVDILAGGPAVIHASYTFNFDGGPSPVLTLEGIHTIAFALAAQKPASEVLAWKTDVLEAKSGNEQRIATRRLPRQSFQYKYITASQSERIKMLVSLVGQAGRFLGVPLWHFRRRLLVDAAPGDTILYVDTTNADFRASVPGAQEAVILWRNAEDSEIAAVSEVFDDHLVLTTSLGGSHSAADTDVVPLGIMLPKEPISWTETPNGVVTASVEWLQQSVKDLAADDDDLEMYDDAPVLGSPNFVTDQLSQKIAQKYTLIDGGVGRFVALSTRSIPEFQTALGFETDGAADCFSLRKLLYALRGRQRSFWLPSGKVDMVLEETIGPADVAIQITPIGYVTHIFTRTPFRDIEIVLTDGSIYRRRIEDAIESIGLSSQPVEVLTIDSALGVAITPADVHRISFLNRVRLGSDEITLEHIQIDEISVRIPVVAVKQ